MSPSWKSATIAAPPALAASAGWPPMWNVPISFGVSGGRGGEMVRRPTTSTTTAASAAATPNAAVGDQARGCSDRVARAAGLCFCWRAAASTRSRRSSLT
jgi:hypothetical protein